MVTRQFSPTSFGKVCFLYEEDHTSEVSVHYDFPWTMKRRSHSRVSFL